MQCPQTPSIEPPNACLTPLTTSRQPDPVKRRNTTREALAARTNIESWSVCEGPSTPLSRRLRRNSTPKKDLFVSFLTPSPSSYTPTKAQASPGDVFDTAAISLQTRNSIAIQQFNNAAKKLRLSSVPPALDDQELAADIDPAELWVRAAAVFASPETKRPSRHHRTPQQNFPLRHCLQECDVTSARRVESRTPASRTSISSVATIPKNYDYQLSPTPIHGMSIASRSTSNTLRREPRNFSRPFRGPHASNRSPQERMQDSVSTPTIRVPARIVADNGLRKAQASPGPCRPNARSTTSPSGTKDEMKNGLTASTREDNRMPSPYAPNLPPAEQDQIRTSFDSAVTECLGDRRLQLKQWQVWLIRGLFSLFVFGANIALWRAYLGSYKHPYLLAILVFMKSKDILSTFANVLGMVKYFCQDLIWPPKTPGPKWILNLICAYAETEEQIMKTIFSLVHGKPQPHKQALCIILDGKPRNILHQFTSIRATVRLPYSTWIGNRGELVIHVGLIDDVPIILIEKVKNAGKKDSLILGHDLFNHPREDMPHSTRMLRHELWQSLIPKIVPTAELDKFDFIFCTDADSTIHENALRKLADALCRYTDTIAGCGFLFAEFGPTRTEYSLWHLFQQFQYTFGQYVRRQAESMWGRVTCLPGCITMIVVRPEMGPAISEYARAVTDHNLFRHQVQYLGTDRRLTWCIMSQSKHLRTIFVPDALSQTVVPCSLSHYLSQRRRWASNAYFNDFFYFLGPRQRLITRLFAAIDLIRLTLVFYRVFNTAYFIHGLVAHFYITKIIPTLIVTKTPATWYLLFVICREPHLRKRLHKVLLGMCINQLISPILSVIVFANLLLNMGNTNWGRTGVSTQGPAQQPASAPALHNESKPARSWTPKKLARNVRAAIQGVTPKPRKKPSQSSSSPKNTLSSRKNAFVDNLHDAENMFQPHPTSQYESMSAMSFTTRTSSQVTGVTGSETPPRSAATDQNHTPSSLLKRIPRGRNKAAQKLGTLTETPTKPSSASSFMLDRHDE